MKTIHNLKVLFERRKDLRNHSTPEEILLWDYLKNSSLGAKFRRQHSIGGYIVDFYCPAKKLVIELDGEVHNTTEAREYDKVRDEFLKGMNLKILRFFNKEIKKENILSVVSKIKTHF